MPALLLVVVLLSLLSSSRMAQVVVFWQPDFPTVASRPVDRATLYAALHPDFLDLKALQAPGALAKCELLVLPYGSAVPTDAWKAIETYLQNGGNLLVIGGQPLRVPVNQVGAIFVQGRPQDTYSRTLDLRHTYEVPVARDAHFAWKPGYAFEASPRLQAEKFFTVEGHLKGLGYMVDTSGLLVAAPVIVIDRAPGSRIVCLDFQPATGYWETPDGEALIRQTADYARQGSTDLSVETLFSVLRPNEPPQITVHLQQAHPAKGDVRVELLSTDKLLEEATLPVENDEIASLPVPFQQPLSAGFYKVRATFRQQGRFREFYENGFWVAERSSLDVGQPSESREISSLAGGSPSSLSAPTTSPPKKMAGISPARAMRRCGKKILRRWPPTGSRFVRTGVWMKNTKFIEPGTGEPDERFLRNLEAFFICAQQHGISVNFTFFAFTPDLPAQKNPYLDEDTLRAQQTYVRAVVKRFASVPWLCWDLINEPSFLQPATDIQRKYSQRGCGGSKRLA